MVHTASSGGFSHWAVPKLNNNISSPRLPPSSSCHVFRSARSLNKLVEDEQVHVLSKRRGNQGVHKREQEEEEGFKSGDDVSEKCSPTFAKNIVFRSYEL